MVSTMEKPRKVFKEKASKILGTHTTAAHRSAELESPSPNLHLTSQTVSFHQMYVYMYTYIYIYIIFTYIYIYIIYIYIIYIYILYIYEGCSKFFYVETVIFAKKNYFRQTLANPKFIFSGTCWPRLARKH